MLCPQIEPEHELAACSTATQPGRCLLDGEWPAGNLVGRSICEARERRLRCGFHLHGDAILEQGEARETLCAGGPACHPAGALFKGGEGHLCVRHETIRR